MCFVYIIFCFFDDLTFPLGSKGLFHSVFYKYREQLQNAVGFDVC